MIIGWALGLLSVLIASFSQILLKKAAQKQQNNFIKKFLNVWVICGYILLFGSLFINTFVLRKLELKFLPCITAVSYTHLDVYKRQVEGYRYWDKTQDGTAIYENINAKPLLYVPQTVETKKNFDDIYFNCDNYSLDKTAYVDAEPMDLQNSDTQVEVKEQTRNTVMASCSSTADTLSLIHI